MQTLSQKDFLAKYGPDATLSLSGLKPTIPPAPTYTQGVEQAASAGIDKAKQGVDILTHPQNPADVITGATKAAAGAVETAASPLAPLFSPLGKIIGYVTNKLSDTKPFQDYGRDTANLPADYHPTGEKILDFAADAGTVAGAATPIKGAPAVASAGKAAITDAGTALEQAAQAGSKATITGAKALIEQPIPKNVETVLKETPTGKFDAYVAAAKKATENNKNPTPLEIAGTHAQDALDKIQTKLSAVGAQKKEVMGSGGIAITPIDGTIVQDFRQGLQKFLNSKTHVEGDTKLLRDVNSQAKALGATPSAGQVDRFIDFVQDKIYTGGRDLTVPVTNESTAALRSLVGKLNSSLKKQLPAKYTKINDEYSRLIDLRNELNTKLGKDGEKGGALMKRVFSPSDANTKKLFADIHKETGIDLTNEATLARYVMDVMGDTRQKSMLQELNLLHTSPTPNGVVGKIVDYALEHFNSPDEIIKRARGKTSAETSATIPQQ